MFLRPTTLLGEAGNNCRHPVSKEGYFLGMENTLGWVQNDSVGFELGKEGMEELVVLLGRTTEDNDVVQIEETEVQDFHKPVTKFWKVGWHSLSQRT